MIVFFNVRVGFLLVFLIWSFWLCMCSGSSLRLNVLIWIVVLSVVCVVCIVCLCSVFLSIGLLSVSVRVNVISMMMENYMMRCCLMLWWCGWFCLFLEFFNFCGLFFGGLVFIVLGEFVVVCDYLFYCSLLCRVL